jgi:RNA polymerase sigma-70 factor, ECF subfamily
VIGVNKSDQELVEEILQGHGNLFSEIVCRYKKAVYSLCYRMINNKEDAEDLAQEVFIKVYNHLGQYNPEYKFSTWILKIAHNTTIDTLRKKKMEVVPYDEKIALNQEAVSAENMYFHQFNKTLIEKAIQELPSDYREVILLYHHNGLNYNEIAETIGIPLSKVKNRLHRARNLLKVSLQSIRKEEAQWTAKEVQV